MRNGREAYDVVNSNEPDVLITDIEMPEMTGLELQRRGSKGRSPSKVIVVTTFARPQGTLRRAIDAGALGYLLKDSPARELADAVRRVHAGHRVINSDLAAEALGEPDPLTDRERQVLRLAGDGATSEEIAKRLGLSDGTVRNYLVRSHRKARRGKPRGCVTHRARQRAGCKKALDRRAARNAGESASTMPLHRRPQRHLRLPLPITWLKFSIVRAKTRTTSRPPAPAHRRS